MTTNVNQIRYCAAAGFLLLASAVGAAPLAFAPVLVRDYVAVIDTATEAVVTTIDVGSSPYGVGVAPDGSGVWVTNEISNTVSLIDTATLAVVAEVLVGNDPTGVAVLPASPYAYVSNFLDDTVSVINTQTRVVVATVPVGNKPFGVAALPSGNFVYVANSDVSGTVSVIRTSDNAVIDTVPVSFIPLGLAVHPAGHFVYVGSQFGGGVSVIDTTTNTVVDVISIGTDLTDLVVHPDGSRLFVTDSYEEKVFVIDTATNSVIDSYSVPLAYGIDITPDGATLYVTNYTGSGGSMTALDAATGAGTTVIDVGGAPTGIGRFITPSITLPDADSDGIANPMDNCILRPNADQRDSNADNFGNVCDADLDNDCAVNFLDLAIMKGVFFLANDDADLNGDGVVNFSDLGLMKDAFFQPPGPSGLPNDCD